MSTGNQQQQLHFTIKLPTDCLTKPLAKLQGMSIADKFLVEITRTLEDTCDYIGAGEPVYEFRIVTDKGSVQLAAQPEARATTRNR